jgi:hypothetical protein
MSPAQPVDEHAAEVEPRAGHLPTVGRSRTAVITALVVGSLMMVAFWVAWFSSRDLVASDTTTSYYDFENAFPLADLWVLVALVGALLALRRQSPLALFWLLVGGGAGIYLACMDTLYDVEHGIWGKGGGGAIELVIVVVTFVFSIGLLRWSWRRRHTLLDGR